MDGGDVSLITFYVISAIMATICLHTEIVSHWNKKAKARLLLASPIIFLFIPLCFLIIGLIKGIAVISRGLFQLIKDAWGVRNE
jgi:hypothetical protein